MQKRFIGEFEKGSIGELEIYSEKEDNELAEREIIGRDFFNIAPIKKEREENVKNSSWNLRRILKGTFLLANGI